MDRWWTAPHCQHKQWWVCMIISCVLHRGWVTCCITLHVPWSGRWDSLILFTQDSECQYIVHTYTVDQESTSYFRGSVLVMQVINTCMWYVHTHVCIHLCIRTCTYAPYCLSVGGVFTYLAKLPMLGDACGTRLVYLTSLLEVNNISVERHMDFLCNGRHCATSSPAVFTKMWCINW